AVKTGAKFCSRVRKESVISMGRLPCVGVLRNQDKLPRNREEADLFFCSVTPLQKCETRTKTTMETRTVPWLHRLRLPPRGHLPNGHDGEPSGLRRSRVRCVSFSPLRSGNKANKPPASTVAGTGFA